MLDFGYYNMDCMDGMKLFPDKHFDIAVVDPPYFSGLINGMCRTKHTLRNWPECQRTRLYGDATILIILLVLGVLSGISVTAKVVFRIVRLLIAVCMILFGFFGICGMA